MNLSQMSGKGWGWRAERVISLEDKKEIQRKKEKEGGGGWSTDLRSRRR